MMLPLLKHYQNTTGVLCVTLGLTTAGPVLAAHGIPSRGFASLLRADDSMALFHGKRLASELSEGAVPKKESIAYLGLSYRDLEERLGPTAAASAYAGQGRQSFLPMGPLRRLFDDVKPDVLVTTISPRAEEAALRVALERGTPSMCLVDFFGGPGILRAASPGYGTRVCVLSESTRKWLIDRGRDPEDIVVTGNPAFDRLGEIDWAQRRFSYRKARGWENKKVILWASQIEPLPPEGSASGLPTRIEEKLQEILERRRDWHLLVRPHPNESRRGHSLRGHTTLAEEGEPLDPMLAAADVVVIMTSTIGIEARLVGKPVISVDLSVFTADAPFASEGLSLGIRDLNLLEEAIDQSIQTPVRFPSGYVRPGRASRLVVEQINDLLKR